MTFAFCLGMAAALGIGAAMRWGLGIHDPWPSATSALIAFGVGWWYSRRDIDHG